MYPALSTVPMEYFNINRSQMATIHQSCGRSSVHGPAIDWSLKSSQHHMLVAHHHSLFIQQLYYLCYAVVSGWIIIWLASNSFFLDRCQALPLIIISGRSEIGFVIGLGVGVGVLESCRWECSGFRECIWEILEVVAVVEGISGV